MRQHSKDFSGLWNEYLGNGELPDTDGTGTPRLWYSPQLPALELLVREGVDGFYEGPIAESIVSHLKSRGGILTMEDFRRMDVVERRPLAGDFDGMQIVAMPPPSSGGVAIIESLNILTWLEQNKLNGRLESLGHNSPKYIHVLTESLKHAFADRATWLGDPDFALQGKSSAPPPEAPSLPFPRGGRASRAAPFVCPDKFFAPQKSVPK